MKIKRMGWFLRAFTIAFISISGGCIIGNHPLIYHPVRYGWSDFFSFAILIAILCFGLVAIVLPGINRVLKTLGARFYSTINIVIIAVVVLQLVTLGVGYLESHLNRNFVADALFYYRGITNSHAYILGGNLTTIIIGYAYGKQMTKSTE